MPRALILRHHDEDRPGLVGDALESRGFEITVALLDAQSPTPTLENVDLLVILGSKHAVYDADVEAAWFGRELALIADADQRGVAIFGICFGAQALCRYFGGEVRRAKDAEIGWFTIDAESGSPISSGPWFEYHFDECVLPDAATIWATSPRAVQAFAIGRHVGVQFHPELDAAQLAEWFDAGDDVRDLGLNPEALLEETRRETPAARLRSAALVDVVLTHTGQF